MSKYDHLTNNHAGEGESCKAITEADLVDYMVALPASFFVARKFPSAIDSSRKTKSSKLKTPSVCSVEKRS